LGEEVEEGDGHPWRTAGREADVPHPELQGVRSCLIVVFAVHGTQGYWLFWVSPPGDESTDEAMFDEFVSTFEFVDTVVV
jgi:hypothetical protein